LKQKKVTGSGKDEKSCSSMGCIWEQTQSEAPNCYLPQTYGYRFKVFKVSSLDKL